uniref:Uncharacterized protein n=1 Tax=Dicentrarchus labrax TaxID=13489 RepID=A0A8C4HFN7_DICLA
NPPHVIPLFSLRIGYRQLSLDLVNVGRQRLDFLPMLEHSGTYRETAMHTGTFAQEIITLVHQVKDQYFRDDGVTLNERFSAPQKGGYSEEETEELTLDERFSPGDLRHDLERRRQEKLEGVKVTISGNSMSQLLVMFQWRLTCDLSVFNLSVLLLKGPRRGPSYRPNTGPQRRNYRFNNRLGPVRRQNNRNNPPGNFTPSAQPHSTSV